MRKRRKKILRAFLANITILGIFLADHACRFTSPLKNFIANMSKCDLKSNKKVLWTEILNKLIKTRPGDLVMPDPFE